MIENRKLVLLFNTIDGHCHVTSVDSALEADPIWRVKVLIELGEGGEFISCEKFLSQAERTTLEVPTPSVELSINDAQCKKIAQALTDFRWILAAALSSVNIEHTKESKARMKELNDLREIIEQVGMACQK